MSLSIEVHKRKKEERHHDCSPIDPAITENKSRNRLHSICIFVLLAPIRQRTWLCSWTLGNFPATSQIKQEKNYRKRPNLLALCEQRIPKDHLIFNLFGSRCRSHLKRGKTWRQATETSLLTDMETVSSKVHALSSHTIRMCKSKCNCSMGQWTHYNKLTKKIRKLSGLG